MTRWFWRLALAAALVVAGWTIGRAQAIQPDFEILVDAPGGKTSIGCLRGCGLAWVQRGLNPTAKPGQTFTFSCSSERCGSGTVGGWTR